MFLALIEEVRCAKYNCTHNIFLQQNLLKFSAWPCVMINTFRVLIKFIRVATVFPFRRWSHGEGCDESLASNYISGYVKIKGGGINEIL